MLFLLLKFFNQKKKKNCSDLFHFICEISKLELFIFAFFFSRSKSFAPSSVPVFHFFCLFFFFNFTSTYFDYCHIYFRFWSWNFIWHQLVVFQPSISMKCIERHLWDNASRDNRSHFEKCSLFWKINPFRNIRVWTNKWNSIVLLFHIQNEKTNIFQMKYNKCISRWCYENHWLTQQNCVSKCQNVFFAVIMV